MTARLSPELERLLDQLVDSYEKVEIVWLLSATPRLEVDELGTRVKINADALALALEPLVQAQLVSLDTEHGVTLASLGPRAHAPDVEELIRVRTDDPLSVISALMSLSIRRVRSMAARTFAEAFVLKRDKRRDE